MPSPEQGILSGKRSLLNNASWLHRVRSHLTSLGSLYLELSVFSKMADLSVPSYQGSSSDLRYQASIGDLKLTHGLTDVAQPHASRMVVSGALVWLGRVPMEQTRIYTRKSRTNCDRNGHLWHVKAMRHGDMTYHPSMSISFQPDSLCSRHLGLFTMQSYQPHPDLVSIFDTRAASSEKGFCIVTGL